MWPWGHAAVAYLLYTAYTRRRHGRLPREFPVVALAVGSQFADLVDKPLAWTFDVLPGGRTLGHSLFFAAVVLAVVFLVARQYDRMEAATAFAIGHLSHLLADIPSEVLRGDFSDAVFLLWPLLEPPEYTEVDGILAGFLRFSPDPFALFQFGLFAIATIVWYRDGAPGLGWLWRTVTARVGPLSGGRGKR